MLLLADYRPSANWASVLLIGGGVGVVDNLEQVVVEMPGAQYPDSDLD